MEKQLTSISQLLDHQVDEDEFERMRDHLAINYAEVFDAVYYEKPLASTPANKQRVSKALNELERMTY